MYGKLTVVAGGMFAGKTTYLVNAVAKEKAIVFKPAFDTRYGKDVVTHDGKRVAAVATIPDDLVPAEDYELVCFDEIQFFVEPYFGGDIIRSIQVFLKAGKNVLACGLDTDWTGCPFPVTASLLGMADDVIKLKSSCGVCKGPASKTYKKSRQGSVVQLGNDDLYEPRCNLHWKP